MGIGSAALAGGVEGLGVGVARVGSKWSEALFEEEKQKAIGLREENLARLNNDAAAGRLATSEAGADRRLGVTEAGATARQGAGFKHTEALEGSRQKWQGEQNDLQRTLSRDQIASHERVAAANNSTALKIASIGGTVQSDNDGNLIFLDRSGKPTQIMDPNNPGQPLRGQRDLTPASKAYVDVIKEQIKGLDRAELDPMADDSQKQRIAARRLALNNDLLNVLTGGISAAGQTQHATPTQRDIALLRSNPSASLVPAFDKKFGVGASDKVLNVMKYGLGAAFRDSTAAPGAPNPSPTEFPTQRHIDALKRNPSAKALFDQKFGEGAAEQVLGVARGATGTPTRALLTSDDEARIRKERSPAAQTRLRHDIMQARIAEQWEIRLPAALEQRERLRSQGIDPESAAFDTRQRRPIDAEAEAEFQAGYRKVFGD